MSNNASINVMTHGKYGRRVKNISYKGIWNCFSDIRIAELYDLENDLNLNWVNDIGNDANTERTDLPLTGNRAFMMWFWIAVVACCSNYGCLSHTNCGRQPGKHRYNDDQDN